jgi:tellurite resistance protein TehA-like permease
VEGVSLVLWAFGTWSIPLLVLFGFWRHVWWRDRLTYRTELWAVVFPLGMYATACDEFGAVSGLDFMVAIGRIVFWIALCAWFAVFAAMLVTVPGRWSGPHADR